MPLTQRATYWIKRRKLCQNKKIKASITFPSITQKTDDSCIVTNYYLSLLVCKSNSAEVMGSHHHETLNYQTRLYFFLPLFVVIKLDFKEYWEQFYEVLTSFFYYLLNANYEQDTIYYLFYSVSLVISYWKYNRYYTCDTYIFISFIIMTITYIVYNRDNYILTY